MRRVAMIAGSALVLWVAIALYGGPASDVLVGLVLGWLAYLARVMPHVRIAWDGVATGVLCLVLFTVGLHRTLTWFYGELQKTGGAGAEGPWLPTYVGAVPPKGVEPWDWSVTWNARMRTPPAAPVPGEPAKQQPEQKP